MNGTLLLRLAAPLQAWGTDSKFERRTTGREPSKSGVVGMLAAALGRKRDESLEDLTSLDFGVRIDQPGQLLRDFHTARLEKARNPYVTERFYLMDAVFMVGLYGAIGFLKELEKALNYPVFPIYLGRRSCPPVGKLTIGIREGVALKDALENEGWQGSDWYEKSVIKANGLFRYTLILDSLKVSGLRRRDIPITFNQAHRQHAYRYVEDYLIEKDVIYSGVPTNHNPFDELEV